MFLVTKLGDFIKISGEFPVAFVVTTMDVSSCVCGDQKNRYFSNRNQVVFVPRPNKSLCWRKEKHKSSDTLAVLRKLFCTLPTFIPCWVKTEPSPSSLWTRTHNTITIIFLSSGCCSTIICLICISSSGPWWCCQMLLAKILAPKWSHSLWLSSEKWTFIAHSVNSPVPKVCFLASWRVERGLSWHPPIGAVPDGCR